MPQNISKTQLNLAVSIDGEEKDYLNNNVKTESGYTNISVSPIDCIVNKNNTADIKSTISNVGFTDAKNEMLTGFDIGSYTIDEVSIVPTENNLAIGSYIGKTISIIKKAGDFHILNIISIWLCWKKSMMILAIEALAKQYEQSLLETLGYIWVKLRR